MFLLAYWFRFFNSRLISTEGLKHKALKIIYFFSVKFYQKSKLRSEELVTISNFDGDINIKIDLSKRMGTALFWTGFHEFNELRFVHYFLKPEMVFVDAGANQGEFTLFAAKRVSRGKVLAFEPMDIFFKRLTENVALNNFNNVNSFQFGLSDKKETVPIYFEDSDSNSNEGIATIYSTGQNMAQQIKLVPFDDIATELQLTRVDLVKIDVEGAEWSVLKGMKETISRFKPAFIIELSETTSKQAGYAVDEMVGWIKQFGYDLYLINRGKLVSSTTYPAFCNAVFLPKP